MYSRLQLAKKYLHYLLHASNGEGHGIHSPFVFDFVRNILMKKKPCEAYQAVESLRFKLMKDHSVVHVEDMGAGSAVANGRQRKVSEIVRATSKSKKFGQLLYRVAEYYQPQTIIELGTSLGVSTCYLSKGNPKATVYTLEGAPEIARIASRNFEDMKLMNINVREGNFDNVLPGLLKSIQSVDLAFTDGNHRRDPTLNYFRLFLPKVHSSSILIFDDIHWSRDMEEAWEIIKADPSVKVSIDLFFLGLVFFREEFKTKQHFVIKF